MIIIRFRCYKTFSVSNDSFVVFKNRFVQPRFPCSICCRELFANPLQTAVAGGGGLKFAGNVQWTLSAKANLTMLRG